MCEKYWETEAAALAKKRKEAVICAFGSKRQ
jgi:hypothetical protein